MVDKSLHNYDTRHIIIDILKDSINDYDYCFNHMVQSIKDIPLWSMIADIRIYWIESDKTLKRASAINDTIDRLFGENYTYVRKLVWQGLR